MKKSTRNIILAVVFSLAVHIAVGTAFFYKSSVTINCAAGLNKLNLVWVTLKTKNDSGIAAAVLRPPAIVSRKDMRAKEINRETPENEGTTFHRIAAKTSPADDFAGSVILSGHDEPAFATGEGQADELSGSIAAQDAESPPVQNTADTYPIYRENAPPVYPETARIRGYEGVVLVAAEILPDGRVGNTKIRKSSGYAVLDQSAIEAVKPWKFEPAKKSGKPFAVWVDLPIKFVLQGDNSQS